LPFAVLDAANYEFTFIRGLNSSLLRITRSRQAGRQARVTHTDKKEEGPSHAYHDIIF
jgi:hypothetical protein